MEPPAPLPHPLEVPEEPLITLSVYASGQLRIQSKIPLAGSPLIIMRSTQGQVVVQGVEEDKRETSLLLCADGIAAIVGYFKEKDAKAAASNGKPTTIIQPPPGMRLRGAPWDARNDPRRR